jgi:hypothetical protein
MTEKSRVILQKRDLTRLAGRKMSTISPSSDMLRKETRKMTSKSGVARWKTGNTVTVCWNFVWIRLSQFSIDEHCNEWMTVRHTRCRCRTSIWRCFKLKLTVFSGSWSMAAWPSIEWFESTTSEWKHRPDLPTFLFLFLDYLGIDPLSQPSSKACWWQVRLGLFSRKYPD